ncbi:MAG: hypothetical protein NC310_02180 [Roseburia sp.]|nr:hypothetical protein [Anaeroplasma bactoclasticum]MCM1195863.1 hypothetical protein [Roseburia sp.]MCM1556549.1 hypothetical protein [Anaeroplasma bactoclasticum]
MKRLFFCFCVILLICCSCKKNVEVSFEQIETTSVYAIKSATSNIEEVMIDYELIDETDLFMLYTSYQNTLPIGYSSPANPNITLLSSEVKSKVVYYTVDNFVLLCNISLFHEVLLQTGKTMGYKEIHIILNENQLI